jgi:hypothetical protein
MLIIFYCPNCGREIRVRSAAAGQKGRCADCSELITVPDFDAISENRPPLTVAAIEGEPEMPTMPEVVAPT